MEETVLQRYDRVKREQQDLRQNSDPEYVERISASPDQPGLVRTDLADTMEKSRERSEREGDRKRETVRHMELVSVQDRLVESSKLLRSVFKDATRNIIEAITTSSKNQIKELKKIASSSGSGGWLDSVDGPDRGKGGRGRGGKLGKFLGGRGGAILGTVAALGIGAYSAYDSLTDDTKTEGEKAQGVANAAGGVAGTLAGAAAGAAVGSVVPVVGTAVGGLIGGGLGYFGGTAVTDMIGTKLSKAVENSSIGDAIGAATAVAISPFSQEARRALVDDWNTRIIPGFNAVVTPLQESISDFGATVDTQQEKLEDYLKAISEGGSQLWSGFKSAASTLASGARQAASTVQQEVKDKVQKEGASGVVTGIVSGVQKAAPEATKATVSAVGQIGTAVTQATSTVANAKTVDKRWEQNSAAIVDAAKRVGVDPNQFAKVLGVESAGYRTDAKPGTSSASGLGQFLAGTWAETVSKYGSKHQETAGMKEMADYAMQKYNGPKGFNAKKAQADPLLKDFFAARDDPVRAALMSAEYQKEGLSKLEKAGVTNSTAGEWYSTYFTGNTKLAKAARQNPDMSIEDAIRSGVITQAQVNANQAVFKSGTVGGAIKELDRRTAQYSKFGDDATKIAQSSASTQYASQIVQSPTNSVAQSTVVDRPSTAPTVSSTFAQPSLANKQYEQQPKVVRAASANVPISSSTDPEVKTVEVANQPVIPQVASSSGVQSLVTPANNTVPDLNEIPMRIDDLGLMLLNIDYA